MHFSWAHNIPLGENSHLKHIMHVCNQSHCENFYWWWLFMPLYMSWKLRWLTRFFFSRSTTVRYLRRKDIFLNMFLCIFKINKSISLRKLSFFNFFLKWDNLHFKLKFLNLNVLSKVSDEVSSFPVWNIYTLPFNFSRPRRSGKQIWKHCLSFLVFLQIWMTWNISYSMRSQKLFNAINETVMYQEHVKSENKQQQQNAGLESEESGSLAKEPVCDF